MASSSRILPVSQRGSETAVMMISRKLRGAAGGCGLWTANAVDRFFFGFGRALAVRAFFPETGAFAAVVRSLVAVLFIAQLQIL
jgi:hypothetical protein